MKIAICRSMTFSKEMVNTKKQLEKLHHEGIISDLIDVYLLDDKKEIEKVTLKYKNEKDAMMEYWDLIQDSDAILVLNYDRKSIKNYIGGNSFLEMGFAYGFGKKIYLLNPIPEMVYSDEIVAMKPIVLDGDLNKIT